MPASLPSEFAPWPRGRSLRVPKLSLCAGKALQVPGVTDLSLWSSQWFCHPPDWAELGAEGNSSPWGLPLTLPG